ncbi:hypothetical protein Ddye_006654 [Dipteronia dyeriana]|uniref:Reverse transcriptase domain-containing protein n=1 Tax=Dipteronia dyeriana TaxID=168575 RepID=A0AAD9XIE3_9ROSI|nr:hypothetical protein Ddye_006654 [Dipteronia dyeriana]
MRKMGFLVSWIRLIMDCFSTVSYSFKLNGEVIGNINPSRGLRQGDPLSLYLFLICAYGLSSLLREAQAKGDIYGFKCSRRGPVISHLFFVDDSMLFTGADERNCREIRRVLESYSRVLGRIINYNKSAMCFSPTIPESLSNKLASIVGMNKVECHESYLGLPCFAGRNKRHLFTSIVDRVWKKIKGWGEKLLSIGRKEEAPKRTARSFIWNSLWWGKGLLEKGMRKRVRNGAPIQIYKDNWVPRLRNFKVVSAPVLGNDATVATLFLVSGGWDVQKIKNNFTTLDVEAILKIPIGYKNVKDDLIWHFEGNEIYSVKRG